MVLESLFDIALLEFKYCREAANLESNDSKDFHFLVSNSFSANFLMPDLIVHSLH